MTSTQMAIACGVVLLALLLVVALLGRRRRAPRLPVRSRPVLTNAEIAFYQRLIRALERIGGVDVFPQVCMSAIIETVPGLDSRERAAVRNKFNRKYVDFTVVDAATRPLLVVELDDRTHDAENDVRRDEITGSAGIPTLRIRGRQARDEHEIERLIRTHLSS